MGQSASSPSAPAASTSAGACPIDHEAMKAAKAGGCPIDHSALPAKKAPAADAPAKCPIDHDGVNPLNNMPNLSQAPAPAQAVALPTERTQSTIPRDQAETWEYPSPQQFYNALVRKGWETPEEHVETMVHIHNFLNEAAWEEVLKWEKRANGDDEVQLARFTGKPGQMSPKARLWMFAGWLLPMRFNTEPPFDRHDWIVRRSKTGEEVRYVIDYYSAPPEPDGSPVFSLDVRPALDSIKSIQQRISVATEETWASWRQDKPPFAGA